MTKAAPLPLLARRFRNRIAVGLLLGVALVGTACTRKSGQFLPPPGLDGTDLPPSLQVYATQLTTDGERNEVLHLNELAVAALRENRRDIAKRALDEAVLKVDAVFGSTPEAARARSIFFNEDAKLYKGDPYERAMTYFYRGVLYMQDADWQNARAMFRSAALQDSFAEESQNAADWVSFDYLIAVCEAQLERPFYAQEAFDRAAANYAKNDPEYKKLASSPLPAGTAPLQVPTAQDNLLVIVQAGLAPQKYRTGSYGQFLSYRRGISGSPWAQVEICGGPRTPPPFLDSLYFQAATRGGRPFDSIQGRKVIVKKGTETLGTVGMLGGGAVLMNADNEGQAVAGLVLLASGALISLFASAVQTKADIRQWSSLPDALAIHTSSACEGPQTVQVWYSGSQAATGKVELPTPGEGMAVVLAFPPPSATLVIPPPPSPKGMLP